MFQMGRKPPTRNSKSLSKFDLLPPHSLLVLGSCNTHIYAYFLFNNPWPPNKFIYSYTRQKRTHGFSKTDVFFLKIDVSCQQKNANIFLRDLKTLSLYMESTIIRHLSKYIIILYLDPFTKMEQFSVISPFSSVEFLENIRFYKSSLLGPFARWVAQASFFGVATGRLGTMDLIPSQGSGGGQWCQWWWSREFWAPY